MKGLFSVLVICASVMLTSCVEIIDDISLNEDGSGTFKYTVNLSSSKVKINSILALDSLDGKKIPSLEEIETRINSIVDLLKEKEGISNVSFNSNYDNFLFKLTCDFNSLKDLQEAVKDIVRDENNGEDLPELNHEWISLDEDALARSIPQISIQKTKEIKQTEKDLLKEGTYTSISRFSQEVLSFSNENAKLSNNKKAVMIRTDSYSLTQNPQLLDNTIILTPKQ
jgi:hypothetical protein